MKSSISYLNKCEISDCSIGVINSMEEILLKPIGRVKSPVEEPSSMPFGGVKAVIEVFPEYTEALLRIEENSHIWLLAWFHKAPRDVLQTAPIRVNPDLPKYGVFALRAFSRPNPVAMCLARLDKVEKNYLYVTGLDAVNGTPVLDIKPYFDGDIIFSPVTSYIRPKSREMRQENLLKEAFLFHQEKCNDLYIAIRMGLIAEEYYGNLKTPELTIKVTGSPCLADCIQGLTKARLANPPRFSFVYSSEVNETIWTKNERNLSIKLKKQFNQHEIKNLSDTELFSIN